MLLPASLSQLRQVLLPVETVQAAPVAPGVEPRPAAVLALAFPSGDDVSILLTARPDTLARHAGQVSLPGGAWEPVDASLWQTALRETREELGIKTGRIRPLGQLHAISVSVSNYHVVPYVGWSPVAPTLHPDPVEVASVIEVPLRALLDPSSVLEERWEFRGKPWEVTLYRFGDVVVWGATARILGDLASRLDQRPSNRRFPPGSVRPAS